jgi:hypothetical protein
MACPIEDTPLPVSGVSGSGFDVSCPHTTGSFATHHARADGFLWRAVFHEQWTLCGLHLADYD